MNALTRALAIIKQEFLHTSKEMNVWFRKDAALLAFKPVQGWSAAQILEHITLTNHYLLILIRKGRSKALALASKGAPIQLPPDYDEQLLKLRALADDPSLRWDRPAHMEPTGLQPLHEVEALMNKQLQECLNMLDELRGGEGTLHRITMSVNQLGKIDMYHYLYFLILHGRRHLAQLQRVEREYEAEDQAFT